MPTVVNGLPAHVLLVHFVVVLVPAAALLLILAVAWPAARDRIGVFGPLLALGSLGLAFVAEQAGGWFKDKLEMSGDDIETHADYGSTVVYCALTILVLWVVWWVIASTSGRQLLGKVGRLEEIATHRVALVVVGIASIAVALGSMYVTYLAGDSGAHLVWDQYHDQLVK